MKKFGWILLAGLAFSGGLQAQKIEEVLQSVEQHNKELQASAHSMEAAKMEVQTRNNLEDPSVEYSPFYASNVDGMASSELVVTQGFDFPLACRKTCWTVSSRCSVATFCCKPRTCVWI